MSVFEDPTFRSRLFRIVFCFDARFVEERGPHDGFCHCVRIAVGCGPAVFKVAEPVLAHLAGNPYAGPSVGHARRELKDVGGLVVARQPPGIVLASSGVVDADVVVVSLAQLLNRSFNKPNNKSRKTWLVGHLFKFSLRGFVVARLDLKSYPHSGLNSIYYYDHWSIHKITTHSIKTVGVLSKSYNRY